MACTDVSCAILVRSSASLWQTLYCTKPDLERLIIASALKFQRGWYAVALTSNQCYDYTDDVFLNRMDPSYPGHLGVDRKRVLGLVRIGGTLPFECCKRNWAAERNKECNIITHVVTFDKDDQASITPKDLTFVDLTESQKHAVQESAKRAFRTNRVRITSAYRTFPDLTGRIPQEMKLYKKICSQRKKSKKDYQNDGKNRHSEISKHEKKQRRKERRKERKKQEKKKEKKEKEEKKKKAEAKKLRERKAEATDAAAARASYEEEAKFAARGGWGEFAEDF